jgi:hypothetical protein
MVPSFKSLSDRRGSFCTKRLTEIKVLPALLSGFDPRIFAHWRKSAPKIFVIACKLGACELIRKTVVDIGVKNLLPPGGVAVTRINEEDLVTLSVSLTLATLLYHEVVHVIRLHLPLLVQHHEVSEKESLRILTEVEADKWASYTIAPEIVKQAQAIAKMLHLSSTLEKTLQELLVFYASSLHAWYKFFNQTAFQQKSWYKHPLIRSARISLGVADNVSLGDFDPSVAIKRGLAVLEGINLVEQSILKSHFAPQHHFDLFVEMEGMNSAYSQIDLKLVPKLKEIRKVWGLSDAF